MSPPPLRLRFSRPAHTMLWVIHSVMLGFIANANAADLRDPTRPPVVSGVAAGEIDSAPRLQSILIGPDRRAAIISGQVLQVGSKIGDARVVRIEEDRVILYSGSFGGTLQLFPEVDIKPAKSPPKTAEKKATNEVNAKKPARKLIQQIPATERTQ